MSTVFLVPFKGFSLLLKVSMNLRCLIPFVLLHGFVELFVSFLLEMVDVFHLEIALVMKTHTFG